MSSSSTSMAARCWKAVMRNCWRTTRSQRSLSASTSRGQSTTSGQRTTRGAGMSGSRTPWLASPETRSSSGRMGWPRSRTTRSSPSSTRPSTLSRRIKFPNRESPDTTLSTPPEQRTGSCAGSRWMPPGRSTSIGSGPGWTWGTGQSGRAASGFLAMGPRGRDLVSGTMWIWSRRWKARRKSLSG